MVSLVAAHTVAGHDGAVTDELNIIFAKKTSSLEFAFYEAIMEWDSRRMESELLQLSQLGVGDLLTDWMPSYYGSLSQNLEILNEQMLLLVQGVLAIQMADSLLLLLLLLPLAATDEKKYLVLSNLYQGFNKPSILDIKLGSVLTDDLASPEKVERLRKVSESTTSGTLAFRICGMKIYTENTEMVLPHSLHHLKDHVTTSGNYVCFNKLFGRGLTKDNVSEAIKLFVSYSQTPEVAKHYLTMYWKRLSLLYNCLLDYEVRIISGSLLFIVENGVSAEDIDCDQLIYQEEDNDEDDGDDEDAPGMQKISTLNLIDFAHAKIAKGQGPDENILRGIENLKNIFEELLKDL